MEIDKSQVPSFDTMLQPTLQALIELQGKASVDALDQKVIQIMKIPPSVQRVPHTQRGSDRRSEVCYRLAWARTYLKKFGIIENPSRSKWKLSENFDKNVEALDPKHIVRTVRQKDLEAFKQKESELPRMEASQAFEGLALSVLRDYGIEVSPMFVLDGNMGVTLDAFLPQGFYTNDRPTFVEIKNSFKGMSARVREQYCAVVKMIDPHERFLLIVGEILSLKEKSELTKILKQHANCEICIWDYDELMEHSVREPDHIEYLEQPRAALAKGAIQHRLTDEERRKNNENHIKILKEEYRKGNVTLFLGAGVSQASGLPSWEELVQRLLMKVVRDELEGELPSGVDINALGKLIGENATQNLLTQVRYINSLFSGKSEYKTVRDVLYRGKVKLDAPLLNSICKISRVERISKGIKDIVTYNFDDVLERAFDQNKISYAVGFSGKDIPDPNQLNIYHVHGFLPQRGAIGPDMALIFSEEDYHKVYRDAFSWSNLVQLNAFRESTCLFIGCSLTDPNVRRLLDVYKQACEEARHFAFLRRKDPVGKTWDAADKMLREQYRQTDDSIRDDYFRSIGVNVIWVDSFDDIPPILNDLRC